MPQLPTTYKKRMKKNNNYNKSNLYKYLNLTIKSKLVA